MSAASGKCGNATAHFSNATCNGGDDSAALADWIAYGHGLGATRAVLFIPPGCTEGNFGGDGNASFSADVSVKCAGYGSQPITTVQNAVIWGYGTHFTNLWFGGAGFFNFRNTQGAETGCGSGPTNSSPLIQAANAGDTTVTLITPSDATGNIAVGDWIVVAAIGTQGIGSYPPNPQIHEHKLVTAINTGSGVITLNEPLKFSYKTTYPDIGGLSPYEGGPATIYVMEKTYNNVSQYYGMTLNGASGGNFEANVTARSIALIDVVTDGIAETMAGDVFIFGGYHESQEVDKNDDLIVISGVAMGSIQVVSASPTTMIVANSNVRQFFNGTPINATITNVKTPSLIPGTLCCGQSSSLILDGVTFTTANFNLHHTSIAPYSFSGGTLTISKTDPEYTLGTVPGMWVPGHKYFVGGLQGFNDCVPSVTFTALDISESAGNFVITTDLVSIPPGNICNNNNQPVSTFGSYNVMNLTQKFSGPGNLLSNPETLPP